MARKKRPVVLVFSGHDPSGGAGVQADIEAIAVLGCHAATIITAQTVQNSQGVSAVLCNDTAWIEQQCRAIVEDMPIAAVKIGLLGSARMAKTVGDLLKTYALPDVVLDPVLVSGSGYGMVDAGLIDAVKMHILSQVIIATPNRQEAVAFVEEKGLSVADQWLAMGCKNVLITGADEDTKRVHNRLTGSDQQKEWVWERLPGNYHGTGCTLASAVACFLAQGCSIEEATEQAQGYVYQTLLHAHQPGQGMPYPLRVFGDA